jgi:hypothetical protein
VVIVKYFVEIHAVGSTERHEITGVEARIGSGATSSIRPRQTRAFQTEHVRLVPSESGCRVSLMPGVPGPLMYAGAPQWEVLVPWGDEVFLEGTRFTFLREGGRSKRPSPVLLAVTAVVLMLAAVAFARSSEDQEMSKLELEPPALLEKAVPCSESDPSRAATLAVQTERSAFAKEERSAFEVADGAQALGLLSESEACYRLTGNAVDADRLKTELLRWAGQTNEDYAAARLRLRIAIEHQRWDEAMAAVQHLRALLVDHEKQPYTEWLSGLHHELERKMTVDRR